MIRSLQRTDLQNFIYFCQKRDPDFYITQNNKRLFLSDIEVAKKVFNNCLKYSDKCFIKESNNEINAILLIIGYKEKFERKYIKLLISSKDDCRDLFQYLQWQNLKNLFIKSRKNNVNFVKYDEKLRIYKPSYFARKTGFKIIAVREKEILLKKEEYKREYNKYSK
jgi:hypothetical protein